MASSALSLQVGEIVVYGSEGFARVDGLSEREVLGRTVTVLDLFVLDSSMTVSVPLERAQERGLRPVATLEEAETALDTIATPGTGRQMPWNRDGRMLKERFAEGNIDATVDVLCSLVDAESLKRLNDGQKTLLDKARILRKLDSPRQCRIVGNHQGAEPCEIARRNHVPLPRALGQGLQKLRPSRRRHSLIQHHLPVNVLQFARPASAGNEHQCPLLLGLGLLGSAEKRIAELRFRTGADPALVRAGLEHACAWYRRAYRGNIANHWTGTQFLSLQAALTGHTPQLLTQDDAKARGQFAPGFHGGLLEEGFGLHPLRYVHGLARAAIHRGARIVERCPVIAWHQDGKRHHLETPIGTIVASKVIVAAGGYQPEALSPLLRGRVLPALSNIIATRPLTPDEQAAQGWTSTAVACDTRTLLHYFRLLPGGTADLLLNVTNPNAVAVTITSVAQGGGVTVSGGSGCSSDPAWPTTTGNSGVAIVTTTGLSISVPAGSSATVHVAGGASMTNSSAAGCQGATFQIPVTVTVTR